MNNFSDPDDIVVFTLKPTAGETIKNDRPINSKTGYNLLYSLLSQVRESVKTKVEINIAWQLLPVVCSLNLKR